MFGCCTVTSATLRGVEAVPTTIEVAVSNDFPGIHIVGIGDTAAQEARERVRYAIKASGFTMPTAKVVVSLTPSSLKKDGSSYDVPIALGILAATGQIPPQAIEGRLFAGELSLDGYVRPVRGSLAYALCARSLGYAFVGACACEDIVSLEGLEQLGIRHLRNIREDRLFPLEQQKQTECPSSLDFKDIAGQEVAKRALQIAVAGNHGVLMMGAPGSGKNMLAARVPSIMPPLDDEERLQAALIRSVCNKPMDGVIGGMRPFRSPHHSATLAGLVGGGSPVRPGEVSLAHGGVLYLEDIQEFKPAVLQSIRQPLESGNVHIARADGNVTFPARFALVASAQPCSCGFYGEEHPCTCTPRHVEAYQNRIGGPLSDCFDICVRTHLATPEEILSSGEAISSAQLKEGVMRAQEFAAWRAEREGKAVAGHQVVESCHLDDDTRSFLERAARMRYMSGKAIIQTLKVARTIADMSESPSVTVEHVREALALRLAL